MPASPGAISFHGGGDFYGELKREVRAHLADPARTRRAERRMIAKTLVISAWLAASWVALVFWASNWWQATALAVSLGLAVAGISFNVTHDANHGSYSARPWLNRTLRWSLDLVGASSYVWRTKHNAVHHTYTNIAGHDSDIEAMPLARFAPEQPRHWHHRFQHIYIWPLYALLTVKWHTIGDVGPLVRGRIGQTPLRWPRRGELAGLVLGKLAFVAWTLAIPMLVRPVPAVLACFAIASAVVAFTLSITFQLAHCLEEADFPDTGELRDAGERREWARHQVETTVDFAPSNRFLTWYLGGLNYQVEHHLFSKVCHVHYPAIAEIVRDACARHGIAYRVHPTLGSAVASHTRWLRRMGRAEPATRAEPAAA